MDNTKKKIGRPTNSPKTQLIKFRCDLTTMDKLDFCCRILKKTRSEVMRFSVDNLFVQIHSKIHEEWKS